VGGAGPALAGAEIAPFGVAAFAVSLGAASVVARIGTRATLVAGLVLCGAGLVVLVLLGPPGSPVRLLPGLLLFGAGAGLVNPTMTVVALGSVPVEHAGTAAGVNNAARQFGIAAGIAGFGAVVHGPLMDASVVIRADALDRVLLLGVGLTTAAVLLVLLLVRGGPDPRPT
jgi:predicted MFS family arabinose efflux permease